MGLAFIFLPRITSEVSFPEKGLDVRSVFPLPDTTNFKLKLPNMSLQIDHEDPCLETPKKTTLKILQSYISFSYFLLYIMSPKFF